MILKLRYVEQTDQSHALGTAVKKCSLKARGYREEEYLVYGTANVYERQGEGKGIRFRDAPYVNRVLIRLPENADAFSGNVMVEILNSTSGFDIDRCWVLTREELMRRGDIYVGITSKPNAAKALQRFDPERYKEINWNNPLIYHDIPKEKLGNLADQGMPSQPDTEDGLFWDMLLDLTGLLKKAADENPIRAYLQGDTYFYLAGWSQSGGYLIRYIRDFASEEGKDLFDGFFSCGSVSMCMPNLNQEEPVPGIEQDRTLPMLNRPMVDMHTLSENTGYGNDEARMENSDVYRVYDIAGPSHDTSGSMQDYYAGDEDLKVIGSRVDIYPGADQYPNSFPYELAYQAAWNALCRWVREGLDPIVTEPVRVNEKKENMTGADGNVLGGWRLPVITLPLCAYVSRSTPASEEQAFSASLYGHEEPFSLQTLKEKYIDAAGYAQQIRLEAENSVREGLLLFEDVEALVEYACRTAKKFGL